MRREGGREDGGEVERGRGFKRSRWEEVRSFQGKSVNGLSAENLYFYRKTDH